MISCTSKVICFHVGSLHLRIFIYILKSYNSKIIFSFGMIIHFSKNIVDFLMFVIPRKHVDAPKE